MGTARFDDQLSVGDAQSVSRHVQGRNSHSLVSCRKAFFLSVLIFRSLSGWDRTPLFISLIRCVAWAEGCSGFLPLFFCLCLTLFCLGAAHASLTVDEFLYLTLAYDWMLFRHRLADRMMRREEVMFFSFFALAFVAMDDSVSIQTNLTPEKKQQRREKLLLLQATFTSLWKSVV